MTPHDAGRLGLQNKEVSNRGALRFIEIHYADSLWTLKYVLLDFHSDNSRNDVLVEQCLKEPFVQNFIKLELVQTSLRTSHSFYCLMPLN